MWAVRDMMGDGRVQGIFDRVTTIVTRTRVPHARFAPNPRKALPGPFGVIAPGGRVRRRGLAVGAKSGPIEPCLMSDPFLEPAEQAADDLPSARPPHFNVALRLFYDRIVLHARLLQPLPALVFGRGGAWRWSSR
jgi:hypothetical protein